MKEYTVKLTEQEIELLMYATESASARAQIQAAQGKRDKEKTEKYTDRLCAVNSKLYRKILEIHA